MDVEDTHTSTGTTHQQWMETSAEAMVGGHEGGHEEEGGEEGILFTSITFICIFVLMWFYHVLPGFVRKVRLVEFALESAVHTESA